MNIKDLSIYKHKFKTIVRYEDIDTFGHVNNKAYLAYLEEARIDFNKKVFQPKDVLDVNSMVARIEINYRKQLFYEEELWIYTRVSRIGNKSFELASIFVAVKDGKTIHSADAKAVLVAINPSTKESRPIPEEDRIVLNKFQ